MTFISHGFVFLAMLFPMAPTLISIPSRSIPFHLFPSRGKDHDPPIPMNPMVFWNGSSVNCIPSLHFPARALASYSLRPRSAESMRRIPMSAVASVTALGVLER
jgi:hypothetical protein